MTQYKLYLEVELNKEDDEEEARKLFPTFKLEDALMKLYARELQAAYDECCLSGHFQITKFEWIGR